MYAEFYQRVICLLAHETESLSNDDEQRVCLWQYFIYIFMQRGCEVYPAVTLMRMSCPSPDYFVFALQRKLYCFVNIEYTYVYMYVYTYVSYMLYIFIYLHIYVKFKIKYFRSIEKRVKEKNIEIINSMKRLKHP